MAVLEVGSVEFAGFYYPEILRELLTFFRRNRAAIGLTDENEYEVHTQLLRAFALVGHLNNTRLDTVATELLIDSANLLESVKRLLRLVGIELDSASPAAADLLLELSEVTTADVVGFIPELAEFATESVPPIGYEVLTGIDLNRTDQIDHVFGCEEVASGVCSVSTVAPNVLTRTSGDVFTSAMVVDHHAFTTGGGLADNGGEFRITEFIDANNIKVARIPGSKAPAFQTEGSIAFSIKRFTADYAAEANHAVNPFTPGALTPVVGNFIYYGHEQVMPNELSFTHAVVGSGITGCYEYFDNRLSKFAPSGVVQAGGNIDIGVNSLLGTVDRRGAQVIVENLITGSREKVVSGWVGGVNTIQTLGLLGQTVVSTTLTDYQITADWVPFDGQADGTSDHTADGSVTFELPQDQYRSWRESDVNLVDAWWSRYRIISVAMPVLPSIQRVLIAEGDQFMIAVGTQGETIGPLLLGSSSGAADQSFDFTETPYIDDTETIEVDEGGAGNWIEYTKALNFLNSGATSRHYVREVDATDLVTIRFGNGANGKIPPFGVSNVRALWRVGADIEGNVGVGQIVVNADGTAGISDVINPRAAIGWKIKDGGDDADLIRIKRDGPASLRTRDTAANVDDVLRLATAGFVDSDGTKPVARAVAIEEGLGLKTVKLLVVGSGGTVLSADQKADLESYFNGDRTAVPPVGGRLVINHQVSVFNFEPKLVSIVATVTWPNGNAESVRNALLNLLMPLALEEDGVTYVFDFNDFVSLSRVYKTIHDVDPSIDDVPTLLIDGAAASLKLGANELPVTTAASISINIQN